VISLFSTPKPFNGHLDIIQRNAIQSWRRLHPDVEIILVGDDEGTTEVCQELALTHIKHVKRNRFGTKYLASVYDQAQEVARHRILCHVNCDIVLMSDFWRAVQLILRFKDRFLMAGQRWDVDVGAAIDFERPDWESEVQRLAFNTNQQRPQQWIDYFVFPKGLYLGKVPEFVIGRPGWDNWLLWYASSLRVPVVDASRVVAAVHQNHDYSYHPEGEQGVWHGEEAQANYKLLRTKGDYTTLGNASHFIDTGKVRRNYRRLLVIARSHVVRFLYSAWFSLLNVTRPVRALLGLRSRKWRADGKRRVEQAVVLGCVAVAILWWIWEVFSRGEVPPGRGW